MKTYTDVSMIMIGTRFTGIPRVVLELVKRLSNDIEQVFIEYNANKDSFEIIDTKMFIDFCGGAKDTRRKMRTGKFIGFDEFEPNAVFFDADTVWKTRVRRSFLYPILKENNVKIVPLIYDIIPITHPQFVGRDDGLCFIDYFGAALDYATGIIVNSEATKQSICEICNKIDHMVPNIEVVGLGGNFARKEYQENEIGDEVREITRNGEFILMVGTLEPRKNHKLILDAFDLGFPKDMQVVIAGFPGQNMEPLLKRINDYRANGKKVWHLSHATDADIDYLYKNCFALTYSSYIEGYGLPIIEAFSRDVLVIAADTPVNKEIGGDKAIYFAQDSPESLQNVLNALHEDADMQKKLKESIEAYRPPRWEDSANRFSEVLKSFN